MRVYDACGGGFEDAGAGADKGFEGAGFWEGDEGCGDVEVV